jgi:hypothetical protein
MAVPKRKSERDGIVDIAVVGAGASGAYACWRLKQAGRNPVLYESTDRVGGRLWSIRPPGMPNLIAELGGMRFLTTHRLLASLGKELGLKTDAFPTGGDENLAFLRGTCLRVRDFKQHPENIPYVLRNDEKLMKPGELLVRAIVKHAVPGADKITDPRDWEHVKKNTIFKGRVLSNWGFWNMLLETEVLSSEAYALLLDGGGYESLADNWNCAEACQYLLSDFPSGVEYRRFVDGFQELPKRLVGNFEKDGGELHRRYTLQSFTVTDNGGMIEAKFFDEKNKQVDLVRAKSLILAMPQRRLKILAQTSPSFQHPDVRELLDSVTAMPAFKILLGFTSPWWEQLGISAGRSTTDLPARQVYYAGSEKGMGDPSNENSLLLASYADGRSESFWRALQLPERTNAKQDIFQLDHDYIKGALGQEGPGATSALVRSFRTAGTHSQSRADLASLLGVFCRLDSRLWRRLALLESSLFCR